MGMNQTGTTPGYAGRFDGYDVLSQVPTWDDVTAGLVLRRLGPPQPLRFFSPAEQATASALFDQLLDQREEPKVPVLAMVDERLNANLTDGWRYEDMQEDRDAWHSTLTCLESDAQAAHHRWFWQLPWDDQARILHAICDRGSGDWYGMNPAQVWGLWTRYACTAFYAHPWAWNEIGFGGPAYPRGYRNLGLDRREPWERPERAATDPIPEISAMESGRREGIRG
jgi:Gluconate 2-dehydrogenase subunit 3